MDFQLTSEQKRLQHKCRELAADFASRSGLHDRDASHSVENYDRLRKEGFLALSLSKEWGGLGASFFDHTIAYEALGEGCPSTALAFNMHASVVMPLLESTEVAAKTKRHILRASWRSASTMRMIRASGGSRSKTRTTRRKRGGATCSTGRSGPCNR